MRAQRDILSRKGIRVGLSSSGFLRRWFVPKQPATPCSARYVESHTIDTPQPSAPLRFNNKHNAPPHMKPKPIIAVTIILVALFQCSEFPAKGVGAQSNTIAVFPGEDALNPSKRRLVWQSMPGLRYEVRQSTNLQSWATAPGFPAVAEGPAQEMPFVMEGAAGFFQVRELDDQPPAIVSQFPKDGSFAVPRLADITVQLSDVTGVDPASLRLTLSTLGTFSLLNTNLSYANNILTFHTSGDTPLGGWGSNVLVSVVLGDTLGNYRTNNWNFTIELQPQVTASLFVFGSSQAQRTGQRVGNIPTAALGMPLGPVPLGSGDSWVLDRVETNCLVLTYTNMAPSFAINTYVCNLTPARPQDIFYRKVTSASDDRSNKKLTLFTVDVPLTEIVTGGSATVSANSVILKTGTNGNFVKTLAVDSTITFPRIGYSMDGTEFTLKDSVGGFDIVNLTLEELHWWLTPRVEAALELSGGKVKRFKGIASGNLDCASVLSVDMLLAGLAVEKTIFKLPESLQPKTWMLLGFIGPVPLYASLGLGVDLKARAETHATLNFRAGLRQTADAAFGLTYNDPNVQWVHSIEVPSPEVVPFTASINAEGSINLSLEPALEFLVYGLAGVSAGITPSAGVVFETGTDQRLSGRLEAGISLDLGLAGPAFSLLNPQPELSLPLWEDEWHLFPKDAAISFERQPQSQIVQEGGSAYFFCTVSAPENPSYQWYFNGVPMPGQTARTLLLPSVTYGHAGQYSVRASVGKQAINSDPAALTVLPASLQSGLVAYYPFDGNASDASGYNNSGVLHAAPTFGSGMFGQAIHFNGIDQFVEVAANSSRSFYANPFSVVFWFRTTEQDFGYMLDSRSGPREQGYGLIIHTSGPGLVWGVQNDAQYYPSPQVGPHNNSFQDGKWHLVAGLREPSSIAIYIDGALVERASLPANLDVGPAKPLRIGTRFSPNGSWDYYTGDIDDLRIYNRTLSASEIQDLYNLTLPPPTSGMALVPGGSFTMGDGFGEGDSDERPQHTVYTRAFFMDRCKVKKGLWDSVYQWATSHGYTFDNPGSARALDHPVQGINWYDMVKWCNARSEKEGLTPCYYMNSSQSSVYRQGNIDINNTCVSWAATGYRLPTEAEWEKAARAGLQGRRFPWGNTINESQANYSSKPSDYAYDVSTTTGFNPVFAVGAYPYTSPVKYFPPNAFGLYDMAGNVLDWCWDWYDDLWYANPASTSADNAGPVGPLTMRATRGGGWTQSPYWERCSFRDRMPPTATNYAVGFRCVRRPNQP